MAQFWAVGVGPGDPELMTVKAVNIIRQAKIIYHAGPKETEGRALSIIRHLLRPEQQVRTLLTEPMSVVSGPEWRDHYCKGVDQIATNCRHALEVVFITEGDPTVYSTAALVWQLLGERYPEIAIEIVPGVSSLTAAAARIGWPLAQRNETIAIVPAGYHAGQLQEYINNFTTVCFLKAQEAMPQLAGILETSKPGYRAAYVENLGTPQEFISENLQEASGRSNYFSLVLVQNTLRSLSPDHGRKSVPTGKLWVVGLGPGDSSMLGARALAILRDAEAIVGYEGYLQSLVDLGLRGKFHGSKIGAEIDRARQALSLARDGRRVVVVSSGDAGVYGMASLVLEIAESLPDLDIEIVPGVTAAVAAASLLGAPLGHDFACLSLSDLLTPWTIIESRLIATAQSDFVVALYNPVSQRRNWQLLQAREILLRHRSSETMVGFVDKAFRPGSRVWYGTLANLSLDGIGMETMVIVGNSQTRLVRGRMVTPRGYTNQKKE